MTIRLGFEIGCPRCKHEDAMKLTRAEGEGTYYLTCRYCQTNIFGTREIATTRAFLKKRFPELIGREYTLKTEQRDGYTAKVMVFKKKK